MKPVRILVAEDDPNILTGLIDTLTSEAYQAVPAGDGLEALKLFGRRQFDLVVLDIMMPGMSGYDVCREIRAQNKEVPILMLTAKGEEIDKVVGLELGADDYVTKPFGVRELLARIAALLRRCRRNNGRAAGEIKTPELFLFGSVEVDGLEYRVKGEHGVIDISSRELLLLQNFYAHPGAVLSREHLLNAVWGVGYYGTTRTLDQHIAQLRKKVEPDPNNPTVITTVHGVGYRYEGGNEA